MLHHKNHKDERNLIKQNYRYEVEIIKPEKIDKYRRKNQLNLLNRIAFEKIIIMASIYLYM